MMIFLLFSSFLMSTGYAQDAAVMPAIVSSTASPEIETMIDTPAFLNSATDSQRKEYIELEGNPNLTMEMKQKALTNWALRCGNPVNGLYTMYMAEKQTLQEQEDQRMSVIVAQLSPEAQQADKHVRGITSNLNQTKKEMDTNVAKQLKKLPKKVYYELTFATQ
ncbi:hypothetical protein B9Z55_012540 [Caenorhabditis nigoni]|uniref:SXP/RAL-2 family protein Ani s 5-like cation-binding domain-containing protein n=2 Tax=Caenorhabditis nigoni TaxID=1611254 RepID=A0A2G5TXQ9_9PELO|nr:hypothetical protein B9Z55_012540 [Caenorhabditis nigoni]